MRVQLKKDIKGTVETYGKNQHCLSTTTKIEEHNILKPSFGFNDNYTSGYLKYFTFIPVGTEVKITLEWETK